MELTIDGEDCESYRKRDDRRENAREKEILRKEKTGGEQKRDRKCCKEKDNEKEVLGGSG
jgi:hypothetical protein